jgi:PncC family amidohydrolase
MVLGARALFDTDVAVSITGIAGPGGGMPGKPVGLTYLAAATRKGIFRVVRRVWPGDREAVKAASAECALELLLEAAQQDAPHPPSPSP